MTGGQRLMAVCVVAGYVALGLSIVWPRIARRQRARRLEAEARRRERIRRELARYPSTPGWQR